MPSLTLTLPSATASWKANAPIHNAVLRVTQVGADMWAVMSPALNVTQTGADAWVTTNPSLNVTQVGAEAWGTTIPTLRVSQVGDVIWVSVSPPGLFLSNIVRETLAQLPVPGAGVSISAVIREALTASIGSINVSAMARETLLYVYRPVIVSQVVREVLRTEQRFDLSMISLQVAEANDDPIVNLRYSDTRGASWSNPIQQTLGQIGKYDVDVSFRRLGSSRDRVFELSWATGDMALTGVFLLVEIAEN